MLIRRSTYVHLTPLGGGRVLIVHAMSQLRLVIDAEVAGIIAWFDQPRLQRVASTAAHWTREALYPSPVVEDPALDFMGTRRIVGRGRLIIALARLSRVCSPARIAMGRL